MKIFGFLTVLGAVYGQGYGNGGDDNKCPKNMEYNQCGSPCEPTCDNMTPVCATVCVEKCTCRKGYILNSDGVCVDNATCNPSSMQYQPSKAMMNRIEKAVTKCMVYMEKVMTCEPPAGKIPKYTHRLSAVFLDAVHHVSIGKCAPRDAMTSSYRKRRDDDDEIDAEFDALMAEIAAVEADDFAGKTNGGKKKIPESQLNKLGKLCKQSTDAVLKSKELTECKKLGAWKNRADHLLNDIDIMRNVCKNQAAADAMAGGY